jgi:hypothetical protein
VSSGPRAIATRLPVGLETLTAFACVNVDSTGGVFASSTSPPTPKRADKIETLFAEVFLSGGSSALRVGDAINRDAANASKIPQKPSWDVSLDV